MRSPKELREIVDRMELRLLECQKMLRSEPNNHALKQHIHEIKLFLNPNYENPPTKYQRGNQD